MLIMLHLPGTRLVWGGPGRKRTTRDNDFNNLTMVVWVVWVFLTYKRSVESLRTYVRARICILLDFTRTTQTTPQNTAWVKGLSGLPYPDHFRTTQTTGKHLPNIPILFVERLPKNNTRLHNAWIQLYSPKRKIAAAYDRGRGKPFPYRQRQQIPGGFQ